MRLSKNWMGYELVILMVLSDILIGLWELLIGLSVRNFNGVISKKIHGVIENYMGSSEHFLML